MKKLTIVKKNNDTTYVNIFDFSVEEINYTFAHITAEIAFKEYPNDPLFLPEFISAYMAEAQKYLDNLKSKKRNIYE